MWVAGAAPSHRRRCRPQRGVKPYVPTLLISTSIHDFLKNLCSILNDFVCPEDPQDRNDFDSAVRENSLAGLGPFIRDNGSSFPEEVEARKEAAAALNASSEEQVSNFGLKLDKILRDSRRSLRGASTGGAFRSAIEVLESGGGGEINSGRRLSSRQFQDAALALRLQREEFLVAFRNSGGAEQEIQLNYTLEIMPPWIVIR
ncbi:hypothetical protein KSP40_PGU020290 [Platanthera guangdongensis]|uniref:Uncharacterized protein n=1 Tax=Platanthera guangdongensis TaxID=2320717 RepID=A0ABR2LE79_9ASPA